MPAGAPLQSEGKRAILYKEYYVIKGGFPLSFCDKCGAYIPIGETECPACGYDPEAEAKKAAEAAQRAAEEERHRENTSRGAGEDWPRRAWWSCWPGGRGEHISEELRPAGQPSVRLELVHKKRG